MRWTHGLMCIAVLAAFALALPAVAEPGRRHSDHDFDAGNADRLVRGDAARADRATRTIHARPLTTVRVNTASTRAVDRRRAMESGVVTRPRPRAYVVTNPTVERTADRAHQREHLAQAFRDTSHRARAADLSAVRHRSRVEVRFINTRPDPVTDQLGNVRAQPPIARRHDSVEPANHRRIITHRPRVTHVTQQTRYTRPVHDLHVGGSGHAQWHTRTEPVDHARPRYRQVFYPHEVYFIEVGGAVDAGYHEHWEGDRPR